MAASRIGSVVDGHDDEDDVKRTSADYGTDDKTVRH
jgi:hypothetical protein